MEVNFTVGHRTISRWVQFGAALFIGWLGMIVCKVLHVAGGAEYGSAFVGILVFIIFNCVVSVGQKSYLRYTIPSYYIYVALVAILFYSAKLFSGISIWKLDEYRSMIGAVTVFYIVVSILVRAIRFIYEAAESDDF